MRRHEIDNAVTATTAHPGTCCDSGAVRPAIGDISPALFATHARSRRHAQGIPPRPQPRRGTRFRSPQRLKARRHPDRGRGAAAWREPALPASDRVWLARRCCLVFELRHLFLQLRDASGGGLCGAVGLPAFGTERCAGAFQLLASSFGTGTRLPPNLPSRTPLNLTVPARCYSRIRYHNGRKKYRCRHSNLSVVECSDGT